MASVSKSTVPGNPSNDWRRVVGACRVEIMQLRITLGKFFGNEIDPSVGGASIPGVEYEITTQEVRVSA